MDVIAATTTDPSALLGPLAALALALVMLALFYTGKVLPRNTVPREDYENLRAVNATYAAGFAQLTEAMKSLTTTVDRTADQALRDRERESDRRDREGRG